MAGALQGADKYPKHFLSVLEEVNHLEITKLAEDITRIVEKRLQIGKEEN